MMFFIALPDKLIFFTPQLGLTRPFFDYLCKHGESRALETDVITAVSARISSRDRSKK